MKPVVYPSLHYTDGSVLSSSCNLFYGVLDNIERSSTRDKKVHYFQINTYILGSEVSNPADCR
jgi:hypothetical protein